VIQFDFSLVEGTRNKNKKPLRLTLFLKVKYGDKFGTLWISEKKKQKKIIYDWSM
jgi:hypothetical protein